jgi:hypothetical protein
MPCLSPSASKPATSERPKTSQWFGDFLNAAGWWVRLLEGGGEVCGHDCRSLLRPVGADIFSAMSRFVKSRDQAFLSLPVELLGAPSGVAGFESLSAPFALAGFESVGAPSFVAGLARRRASSDSASVSLFTAER